MRTVFFVMCASLRRMDSCIVVGLARQCVRVRPFLQTARGDWMYSGAEFRAGTWYCQSIKTQFSFLSFCVSDRLVSRRAFISSSTATASCLAALFFLLRGARQCPLRTCFLRHYIVETVSLLRHDHALHSVIDLARSLFPYSTRSRLLR